MRLSWYLPLGVALAALLSGCASRPTPAASPAGARLERLGHHSLKITTRSPAAQRAFDRGLTLAYSFGHHAAEQEFRSALRADPDCAMAYWGIALVNGPHINFPLVPPDRAATAWEALTQAKRRAARCGPLEQALIRALGARYANPQPADRSPLDQAYAAAMRGVWRDYPRNSDAATLFAEAAMDLHPWDLWQADRAQPWTGEIVSTLEAALRLEPRHPGANHLYVHAMEASPSPGRALPAADRLRTLVPDSSHMVHMPSHIYARVGRWEDAAQANRVAMQADARYRAAYPRPGFYSLYMAHNAQFLAYVAMMQGRSAEALACAHRMVEGIPVEFLKEYAPIADGNMILVSEVLMRFGRWTEILQEPEPREEFPLARALWHFTRAVALTALGRRDEAQAEREAFAKAAAAVPGDRTMGNNAASDVLPIAAAVLDGELAAGEGQLDAAIVKLRQAVGREDQLRYDEPPDWLQPARHTLGAVLLRAGRAAEAETVYREDLQRNPENGWALMGLRDSLQRQDKTAESQAADARFRKVWARADIAPTSTCYCQAGDGDPLRARR